jgi:hypothetical protein
MAEFWPVNEPFVMWVFSKLNPAKPGPICPALLPRVTVAVPITVDPENGTPPSTGVPQPFSPGGAESSPESVASAPPDSDPESMLPPTPFPASELPPELELAVPLLEEAPLPLLLSAPASAEAWLPQPTADSVVARKATVAVGRTPTITKPMARVGATS